MGRGRGGWVGRAGKFWDGCRYDEEHVRNGATALRFAVHKEPDGTVTGYALYRYHSEGNGTVQVKELAAATRQAYAAVCGFRIDIDLELHITHQGRLYQL